MKKNLLILTAFVTCTIAFSQSSTFDGVIEKAEAKKAGSEIVIDGLIDDIWNLDGVNGVVVQGGMGADPAPDASECSAEVKILHDADNIYFLFDVTDDFLSNDGWTDAPDAVSEKDDGFDLAFDTDNGNEAAPDSKDGDDLLLTINYSESGEIELNGLKDCCGWEDNELTITDIEGACTKSDNGWIGELKIPRSALTGLAADADTLGLGIRYNDDDQTASPGDREFNISWELRDGWEGWNVPYDWGSVFLSTDVVKVSSIENTTVSFDVYPNPAANVVNINNVALGSEVSIVNLVGQEIMSTVATTSTVEFSVSELQAGMYLVKVNDEVTPFVVK